jgi:hypothetical protein
VNVKWITPSLLLIRSGGGTVVARFRVLFLCRSKIHRCRSGSLVVLVDDAAE